MMMIGMPLVSGSLDSWRVAWKPLRPGITMSISTASGFSWRARATPSAPFSALRTWCPCFSSMPVSLYISVGESSTIRTRAMVFPTTLVDAGPCEAVSVFLFYCGEAGHVGLDRAQQFFLAERLGQKLIDTHDAPLGLVEQAVLGGQHDHRNRLERRVVLHQRAGLIAIQARHHDVDKDNVRVMINNPGQCIETVDGRDDFAPHVLQQGLGGAADRFRIVDHHHSQGVGMLFHICSTIATANRFSVCTA